MIFVTVCSKIAREGVERETDGKRDRERDKNRETAIKRKEISKQRNGT